ncbi:hypothetical protein Ahy_A09g043518 isoform D [Arachis hypogaea]|uniref:Uncharacterized protein n=1 Tax=Arachis hypogaea TaxID=3818 RepID=A0A445BIG4_ARAHY|nr:hypothetical protein Ahy_A09g043518 isoform D [Arachis hypogaea]
MNIFFEHGISEPYMVECTSEDDEVILPNNASFLKLPTTQLAIYEDIDEEESSDFDSKEDTKIEVESDCDSWHLKDMDNVLDSDEEEATVYPPYNEKAKFENFKLERDVSGLCIVPVTSKMGVREIKILVDEHTCARKRKNRVAIQEWTLDKLVPKLRKHPTMNHGEIFMFFLCFCTPQELRFLHVSQLHPVVLPEDLIDNETVTLDQLKSCFGVYSWETFQIENV